MTHVLSKVVKAAHTGGQPPKGWVRHKRQPEDWATSVASAWSVRVLGNRPEWSGKLELKTPARAFLIRPSPGISAKPLCGNCYLVHPLL